MFSNKMLCISAERVLLFLVICEVKYSSHLLAYNQMTIAIITGTLKKKSLDKKGIV